MVGDINSTTQRPGKARIGVHAPREVEFELLEGQTAPCLDAGGREQYEDSPPDSSSKRSAP